MDKPNKNISRRDFLKIFLGVLATLMTLCLGGPLLSYIFTPFLKNKENEFFYVPGFTTLPVNQVAKLSFNVVQQDSFFRQPQTQDVWVIKHDSAHATVYSPICTHLSCRIDWEGNWQKFVCPCHGSVFSADGQVVSGPAPRPLDALAYKIEKGELYVQWKIFRSGIAPKVEV